MTKQEIISKLSARTGYSKVESGKVLDAVLDIIKGELLQGNDIMLPDIGKLKIVTRAEKKGRNPKTGEEIKIAEHKTISFVPCKAMKDAVNC